MRIGDSAVDPSSSSRCVGRVIDECAGRLPLRSVRALRVAARRGAGSCGTRSRGAPCTPDAEDFAASLGAGPSAVGALDRLERDPARVSVRPGPGRALGAPPPDPVLTAIGRSGPMRARERRLAARMPQIDNGIDHGANRAADDSPWQRGFRRGGVRVVGGRPERALRAPHAASGRSPGRDHRGPAPRPAPPQPRGRHPVAPHPARGQGGGGRRGARARHRLHRAAQPPSARQSGRTPRPGRFRARALPAALGGPPVRIGRGELPGPRDRRGAVRHGQGRFDGDHRHQEHGGYRDRSGSEDGRVPGDARGGDRHGKGRLRAAAGRDRRCARHADHEGRLMPARKSDRDRAPRVRRKTGANDHSFEALLDYLKRNRGFDFTGYKRSTLMRRVSKRMHEVGIDKYVAYQDFLEVHPDEFGFLFNTIFINITAFFRDTAAWHYLTTSVVPAILDAKKSGQPIRLWSAGCASGEEAYTLAMVFAEAMGEEAFRRRVKIYATDIDEEALSAARRAVYTARDMESVPTDLRDRYFTRRGTSYAFRTELRRSVIFGRHDLVQAAPISRIDLLVCRNVLMYLNAETQSRVLARLHFGLAPDGFLFLGKAEMLLSHADLFTPVDLKQRVFRKAPGLGIRQRLAALADAGDASARMQLEIQEHILESALDAAPAAMIVVDSTGTLALANKGAQDLFALVPSDCGRPLQDLEISYRPLELRSLIEEAYQTGRTVHVSDVEKPVRDGDPHYLDCEVTPLRDAQGARVGVSVSFVDHTQRSALRQELERAREDLEHSNEELQSANEELETTNEELQSTNEELETTNEELQSGNEELETMNEELQSTNEELRTINDQLQMRTQQLHANETYLSSILDGIRAAVVVVDRQFRILSWVEEMHELWGLRADEVEGRSLFDLDIGLPVAQLRAAVEGCLRGDAQAPSLELDAVNRRGAAIRCVVTCRPLRQGDDVTGAIVMVQRIEGDAGGVRLLRDNPRGGRAP